MEYFEIAKGVIVFKNVLKNNKKTYQLIKQSQNEKINLFSDWVKWNSEGFKSILNPYLYQENITEEYEFVDELRHIYSKCFTIYKDKFADEKYFRPLGLNDEDLPDMSVEKIFASRKLHSPNAWSSAFFLVGDYGKSYHNNGLLYGYHLDKTPFWGTPPYAYSLNVYPNDDYIGGEIAFISMDCDIKKITNNGIEYYEISEPLIYKPEAGDAILFPSLQYHATLQSYKGEKVFIRMHLQHPYSEKYLKEIENMSFDQIKEKQDESLKDCLNRHTNIANIFYNIESLEKATGDSKKFLVIK